jgi:hypothetical protein
MAPCIDDRSISMYFDSSITQGGYSMHAGADNWRSRTMSMHMRACSCSFGGCGKSTSCRRVRPGHRERCSDKQEAKHATPHTADEVVLARQKMLHALFARAVVFSLPRPSCALLVFCYLQPEPPNLLASFHTQYNASGVSD